MKLLIGMLSGVGGSLNSMNDFQIVVETSLFQDTSLVKFSWTYDQKLLFGSGARIAGA